MALNASAKAFEATVKAQEALAASFLASGSRSSSTSTISRSRASISSISGKETSEVFNSESKEELALRKNTHNLMWKKNWHSSVDSKVLIFYTFCGLLLIYIVCHTIHYLDYLKDI